MNDRMVSTRPGASAQAHARAPLSLLPRLRFGALLLLAASTWASAASTPTWQVFSTSKVSLIGSTRFLTAQDLPVGAGIPPAAWKMTGTLALPSIGVAFGESFNLKQVGP